jgi:serine/threonine protein kinase/uncharacterized caspase-like protein
MTAAPTDRTGVALLVGVGDYHHSDRIPSLRYAASDARALAAVLADPRLCAFPADRVVLLTDGAARRDDVVRRLSRWLPEHANGADLAVIYFAGHGMVQTVGGREEGFLLPHDGDPDDAVTHGVAMSDLARWVEGLDARSLLVCLDCCHAGKLLGSRDVAPAARNMELRPAVFERIAGRGRYLIASCDEGQKSYECPERGHGLFTYHLLQGIAGAADRDGDGRVGIAELFNYVAAAVAREAREKFGREQKPWISSTWGEEAYISAPAATGPADAGPGGPPGSSGETAAAVGKIEQALAGGDVVALARALRALARAKDPAALPAIFRCLGHASEEVRAEARVALRAVGWETVVQATEQLARRGDPAQMAAVLDGLNAFEAHARVVHLLDRLSIVLRGDLRNRAILLFRRKQLGLGLERIAAKFREIHSPYEIEKVLGQGLFTDSYFAHDEATGLEVVVRVLRPDFAAQPDVRAKFLDLSRQSVHLVHEKLALTREVRAFPDNDIYFAVRDYIPGVTLQRVLETGRRFEPAQVLRLVRETAEALSPLQSKGVCHGGVKPSNIFLCQGDRVVLGDPCLSVLGVGVAEDRLTYDYRYAAPEMFRGGGAPGPASDLYALGCVAYELACGQPPFVSNNCVELAALHLQGGIPPPAQRGSRLGEEGDAVVLKLLARSPSNRFGTLDDLLRALAAGETAPPRPLLREASLLRVQGPESVLHFDETGPASLAASRPAGRLPDLPGYEILRQIGQGGMGAVYEARQLSLNRPVAIKAVPLHIHADLRVRLLREGMLAARLQHPNILQMYDVINRGDGWIYLVMELVPGGDLAHRLRTKGPYPIREAAALAATLARAVHHAHLQGVLHRDLKPSNVLLTPEGGPKIADFGLAKALYASPEDAAVSAPGTVLGTPAYMAPEQWQGQATKASDVYTLGMILYELLAGRRPFGKDGDLMALAFQTLNPFELLAGRRPFGKDGDLMALAFQAMNDPPTPLQQLRPETPREFEAICLKCLVKDPARRYASAAALAEDLERWLEGKPVLAPAPDRPRRGSGWWRRVARFFSARSEKPPGETGVADR